MRENKRTWWKDPRHLLSLLLVLLVMAVIYYFSAQPVKKSTGTSDGFVTRFIKFFLPDFKSLPAAKQRLITRRVSFFIRKTAHLLEFAALGFSLRLHLFAVELRQRISRPWLISWAIGSFYAATDEIHQFFVPGRGPRVSDVGIDSLGVLLGLLFLWLCTRVFRRRKPEPSPGGTNRNEQ